MRIIFMGTPEFAVASLAALLNAGKEVVAVVTVPDKPAGRGQKITQSAVKTFALEHGLPVLQPEKLKNPEFLETLKSYKADLQVVVAFRMLPEVVWNMPPLGTINLHASLLPQYRGAAPINHAIINGEHKSGVTTFLLQHEIDTGNILFQEEVSIEEDETAGELHDKLMEVGSKLIVETVEALQNNTVTPIPQEELTAEGEAALKPAPKIFKENCRINWNQSIHHIHNLVRGLSPYPGAFTEINGKIAKIYRTTKEEIAASENIPEPGTIASDEKTFLKISAKDGYIYLNDLQLEGKKRMNVDEFLRGYKLSSHKIQRPEGLKTSSNNTEIKK